MSDQKHPTREVAREMIRACHKNQEKIDAWNKLREDNPDWKPDLSDEKDPADFHKLSLWNIDQKDKSVGINLSGAKLSYANLSWAILLHANLSEANLNGANLSDASLGGANLSGAVLWNSNLSRAGLGFADLSGANLIGADLSWAILQRANLSGADLNSANLRWAWLAQADISGARLTGTIFGAVDLSEVKGLEELRHLGPSTIGVDTLYRSKGKIPEVFLRGCGLQPWEAIAAKIYNPDLTASQIADIQTESFRKRTDGPLFIGGVFISYSHDDAKFVDKLYKRLKEEGVSVWLDRHDAVAGPLERQVIDNIRIQDIMLLVLSKSSVNSDWVDFELEKALKKEVDEERDVLCPVALDDAWVAKTKGPDHWRKVRKKNILDFSKWKTQAFDSVFQKLIAGLKKYYPPQG